MNKKACPLRGVLLTALIIAVTAFTAACGNAADTRVAGTESQNIYGYVIEINDQAKTVTVDQVEMISYSNTQRFSELGIATDNLNTASNKNYVYNELVDKRMYPLADNVEFDFTALDNKTTNNNSMVNKGTTMNNNGTGTAYGTDGMAGGVYDGNATIGTGSPYTNDTIGASYGTEGIAGTEGTTGGVYNGNSTTGAGSAYNNNGRTYGADYSDSMSYNGLSNYDRLRSMIDDNGKTLCLLTIEDGRVVSIRECSDMY